MKKKLIIVITEFRDIKQTFSVFGLLKKKKKNSHL